MQWAGLLIDLAIIAGLGRAFMRGSQVGLMRIIFDVVGLAAAVFGSVLVYRQVNPWVSQHLHLPPILTALVVFSLIWVSFELLYLFLLRLPPLRPRRERLVSVAGLLAALLSSLNYLIVVALSVMLLVGLPLPAQVKAAVNASHISNAILASAGPVQSRLDDYINQNINATLNFLTVEPKTEEESLVLGFRVTNGKVRPDLESKMLVLVNNERTSRGLQPLSVNAEARAVARAHSQDMFARGYFAHVTPEGVDPFQRLRSGGVEFLSAGENLALAPTLTLAHNGLMNSPGHRANILDPSFNTVGIGIIDGGPYGLMITQDFTN